MIPLVLAALISGVNLGDAIMGVSGTNGSIVPVVALLLLLLLLTPGEERCTIEVGEARIDIGGMYIRRGGGAFVVFMIFALTPASWCR